MYTLCICLQTVPRKLRCCAIHLRCAFKWIYCQKSSDSAINDRCAPLQICVGGKRNFLVPRKQVRTFHFRTILSGTVFHYLSLQSLQLQPSGNLSRNMTWPFLHRQQHVWSCNMDFAVEYWLAVAVLSLAIIIIRCRPLEESWVQWSASHICCLSNEQPRCTYPLSTLWCLMSKVFWAFLFPFYHLRCHLVELFALNINCVC